YITLAKLYFMASGYVTFFALPRLLGSAERFGDYGLAVRTVSVLNNVIVAGTIQAVSKFVAEDDARAGAVVRRALRVQLVVGVAGCLGGFVTAAAVIAILAAIVVGLPRSEPGSADFPAAPLLAYFGQIVVYTLLLNLLLSLDLFVLKRGAAGRLIAGGLDPAA